MSVKTPIENVREIADRLKFDCEVINHEKISKTSSDAASALGIDIKSIIKTLLFKSKNNYVAVIIRGSDRVDIKKLERISGVKNLSMPSPDMVKKTLGF